MTGDKQDRETESEVERSTSWANFIGSKTPTNRLIPRFCCLCGGRHRGECPTREN